MTPPSALDPVITGMGFCLPGDSETPTTTIDQLWKVASTGTSRVRTGDFFHGTVHGAAAEAARRWPTIPEHHLASYQEVHHLGLVSLHEALHDAGLDPAGEEVRDSAVLTARAGVDSTYDTYRAWHDLGTTADPRNIKSHFVQLLLGGTWSDVGLIQSAMLRSRGTSFVLSSGCASSAELLGIAADLIRSRREDLVVVTGVDHFKADRVLHGARLAASVEQTMPVTATHHADPPAAPRHDRQMRPYDVHSDCMNYGSGAATLVVESRARAERRPARIHGRILGQCTRRGGLHSAVALATDGSALAEAARTVLRRAGLTPKDITYVNGGAEGDPLFARLEANALIELMGSAPMPLVSSQEACFGHSGAPLGALEAALTVLMMSRGEVCPTAACIYPDPTLPFDPMPGTWTRPLEMDRALSFNYQVGGVYSALLLGASDE
ncbi:beta-ketoacyl synthase N-terminal-like domain-containing protein [Austwickia chelonae]|uniref:beta-ketoacyl synthase N-terminal-like domain-containing protein n=1 Tax=Austwickia chelonae TaxID=100225 RepID=UPI000E240450|nr:beta-ketoacyl synthase N-terminal-like domain-containing protein [Austwickia chelonae]